MRKFAHMSLIVFGSVSAIQFRSNEIEVERVFKSDFGSIELLGVCKATESVVTCWTPERRPFPDMEAKVRKALASRLLNIQFGKKNRLAILRI